MDFVLPRGPLRTLVTLALPPLLALCVVLAPPHTAAAAAREPDDAAERLWRWPLAGEPRVIREFDPPDQRWLPGHRGVDLAADPDDPVLAAGAGRVAFAGSAAGTPAVSVQHGDLRTTYVPVRAEVERGAALDAGDPIGTVAATPRHCGAHSCLHWGLRQGRTYLDPLSLLGRGEIRLLPVADAAGSPARDAQARGWARL